MADTVSLIAAAPDRCVGLDVWMQRVLDRVEKAANDLDEDNVHALRVALRRCRAMAEALSEVNPDPGWRKVRKSTRDLFHALGGLRDTQVERGWVKKLAPARDPVRTHMLRLLARREQEKRKEAAKEIEQFDAKEWKKLARKLEHRWRLFPLESIVFQRLALTKLNEADGLFARARRRHSGAAWHRARIGLKHFRYVGENFMPKRYAGWAGDLRRMQDLLGEVHDLDVLRADLRQGGGRIDPAALERFRERLSGERKIRLAEIVAKTTGSGSLLAAWRSSFHSLHPLLAAPMLKRQSA